MKGERPSLGPVCAAVLLLCLPAWASEKHGFKKIPGPRTECEKCHDVEFKNYRASVHHLEMISCHDCHGGDPDATAKIDAHSKKLKFEARAEDPAVFCGKCHENIRTQFERGPHFDVFDQTVFDLVSCTTCHKYHKVEETGYTWFKTNCVQCHGGEEEELAVAERYYRIAASNEDMLRQFGHQQEKLRARGFACAAEAQQMRLLRNVLKGLGPLSHAMQEEDARKLEGELTDLAGKTQVKLHSKDRAYLSVRNALPFAWLTLAGFSFLILREVRRREKSGN